LPPRNLYRRGQKKVLHIIGLRTKRRSDLLKRRLEAQVVAIATRVYLLLLRRELQRKRP
jgi:hypothetical protein